MTNTILVILASCIASASVVWFFVRLYRGQCRLEANFQERFATAKIRLVDKVAIFIAQELDGYSHFRGRGYLVLTDDELYFERVLGNKLLPIPVASIKEVGETRRSGGQGTVRPMLKVDFTDADGNADAIAWRVNDLPAWKEEITSAIGRK